MIASPEVQPLEGTLVVEMTRYLPGAYAGRELLRLGARVVRLEAPGGDPMRTAAPAWDEALSRGKESVVCDLKADSRLALGLLSRADVVLEGFRPGVAERLGVGPSALPDSVVYCSLTGFGSDGPHAGRAGHDLNYLGWAGALADTAPTNPPVQAADLAAGGLAAVNAVLAGLLARTRDGRGRHVVVSMTHGSHDLVAHRLGGEPVPRLLTGGLACYRVYETADGRWLTVGALEPRFFERLCTLLGRPEPPGAPVRRRGAGRARRRAGGDVRSEAARRLARALRRRGRLRRPRRDARGGGIGLRRPADRACSRRGRADGSVAAGARRGVRGRLLLALGGGLPVVVLAAFAVAVPADARGPQPATVAVRDGDLVLDGRPLTQGAAVDTAPDWSPDLRRIAFSRQQRGSRAAGLMTVRRDGGGMRRLTSGEHVDTQAAWAPDGRRIAFASAPVGGGTFDIRVVDTRGGASRLLVGGPAEDVAPSWSSDGRLLRFVRITPSGAERWEARADGTRARRIGRAREQEWLERTADRWTPRSGPRELLPDLDQRPPAGLTVSGTRLGFHSATDNVGDGPLWLRGERDRAGDPLFVRQLVRLADGGARVYERAGRLWYTPHPPHFHWHLLGFQRFELRRAADFELVVRDRKTGFCLADHYGHAAERVRNFGPPVFFGNCEQGRPEALAVEQGSSPGYTDRYPAWFHGQDIELRGVPAGVYVLVHRANEHGLLEELDYTNNAASLRIRLDWAGSTPVVTVLRTCAETERC